MRVRGTLGRHHELHSDAGAPLLPAVRLQGERRRSVIFTIFAELTKTKNISANCKLQIISLTFPPSDKANI